jgi:hypothetical protein
MLGMHSRVLRLRVSASAALRQPKADSHGVTRSFEDSGAAVQGGYGFHPACPVFNTPQALNRRAYQLPKLLVALLGLPLLYRVPHREPMPSRRFPGWSDDTSSPGLLLPYDTIMGWGYVSRQRIPPLPGATCEVWIPPARRLPPALPTLSHRSVHGLHPSRGSPHRNRSPSRGPCPPAVTRRLRPSPKSLASRRGLLQGLVPATNPFSRWHHK